MNELPPRHVYVSTTVPTGSRGNKSGDRIELDRVNRLIDTLAIAEHGTNHAWGRGCRCGECRASRRAYNREKKQEQAL